MVHRQGEQECIKTGEDVRFNGGTGGITMITNNTERIRVDNSGNVGIGTTNPIFTASIAYSGNNDKSTSSKYNFGLQVHNNIAAGGSNDRSNLIVFSDRNSTQGAMGGYRESHDGHYRGGLIFLVGSQPQGFYEGAPPSTANASASLIEAMRITPDGNIGLGKDVELNGSSGGSQVYGSPSKYIYSPHTSVFGFNGSVQQQYYGKSFVLQAGSIFSNDYNNTVSPLIKGGNLFLTGGNGPISGSLNNGSGSHYHRGGDVVIAAGLCNVGGQTNPEWSQAGDIIFHWTPCWQWTQDTTPPTQTAMIISGGKGNVGIGTNNPIFTASIAYSGNNDSSTSSKYNFGLQVHNKTASGSNNRSNLIVFSDRNSTQGAMGVYRESHDSHYRSGLIFLVGNEPQGYTQGVPSSTADASASLSEAMRISPYGNVGIGTNNPTSKLHVNSGVNTWTGICLGTGHTEWNQLGYCTVYPQNTNYFSGGMDLSNKSLNGLDQYLLSGSLVHDTWNGYCRSGILILRAGVLRSKGNQGNATAGSEMGGDIYIDSAALIRRTVSGPGPVSRPGNIYLRTGKDLKVNTAAEVDTQPEDYNNRMSIHSDAPIYTYGLSALGSSGVFDNTMELMNIWLRGSTPGVQNGTSFGLWLGAKNAIADSVGRVQFSVNSNAVQGNYFGSFPNSASLTMCGDGTVGINVANPTVALEVGGIIKTRGTDFILGSTDTGRGAGGRALVQAADNLLIMNYENDFSSVLVQSDLQTVNAFSGGAATFRVRSTYGSNTSSLVLFQNASDRIADGGASTATVRNDAGDLRLQGSGGYDNATGITIKSNGAVGIGTTYIPCILSVSGSSSMGASGTPDNSMELISSFSRKGTGAVQNSASFGIGVGAQTASINGLGRAIFQLSGNPNAANNFGVIPDVQVMTLTGSGTVGIGTTNPKVPLQVVGGGGTGNFTQTLGTGANSTMMIGQTEYGLTIMSDGNGLTHLQGQRFNNDPTNLDTFPITLNAQGGNVGIGTKYPDTKLHVVGPIKATSFFTWVGNFYYSSGNVYWYLDSLPWGGNTFMITFQSTEKYHGVDAIQGTFIVYHSRGDAGTNQYSNIQGLGASRWINFSSATDTTLSFGFNSPAAQNIKIDVMVIG